MIQQESQKDMTTQRREMLAMRITKARTETGYSLVQLAEMLDVDRNTVAAWECLGKKARREPPVTTLLRMCDLFNCDIGYLLGEHEGKTKESTDIHQETGLSEATIQHLKEYKKYANNLDFGLIEFIDYLVVNSDMRIPFRVNSLLQIPRYKTTVDESNREDVLLAELYSDIKSMINDIRTQLTARKKLSKERQRVIDNLKRERANNGDEK